MKAVDLIPPPLPAVAAGGDRRTDDARRSQSAAPTEQRHDRHALRCLALLLGLLLLAWTARRYELLVPPCPLLTLTDVPCPFCGSTRTFAAMAQLDLASALRLNPLVCLSALGAGLICALSLRRGEACLRRSPRNVSPRWIWPCLLALALAANWLYLWRHLPR